MARKTRSHRFSLPPLELKCMKALWALGGGTVHEIRARLLSERSLAYTTVLTIMDRLTRKGIVEREKRGRAHLYRPLVAEDRVRRQALARLVGDFFQGSEERLRQYLETTTSRKTYPTRLGFEEAEPVASPPRRPAPEGPIDPTLL
jgi:predicted transcriptional regulator